MVTNARLWSGALLVAAALATGCAEINNTPGQPVREVSPDRPGIPRGSGPESQDVLVIGDSMMRSLLGTPVIANAAKPPTVVLLKLENRSRFPIDADIFLSKLRVSLNSKAAGKMIFLGRERMNDVLKERDAKRQGAVSGDPGKTHATPAGADYFLTGSMKGLAKASSAGREDYLLYTFQLIDSESSAIVWEGEFETKRAGQDDAVYR